MRKTNIISRCESIYRQDKFKKDSLMACHQSYILAICHHPGMTQEQLSKHICINKSGVTRHLAFLEEKGYVERRPDANDKRAICVYPTQKMLDIYPEVRTVANEWNTYLTENIAPEELECFFSVLDKIADRAQKYLYEKEDSDK
ncbi:MAG: MarR family transcriptional regulator [Clostridia bacterium]|nr:MarR family transcriptional regulator [Clostridia bacterium]